MTDNDLLNNATALIKAGKNNEAQKLLEPYIEANLQDVNAWLLETKTWTSFESKIKVLKMCLKHNPGHPKVIQTLDVLKSQHQRENPLFSWADLEQWVETGLISIGQLRQIRQQVGALGSVSEQLQQGPEQRKGFNLISVAYYFGSFIILLAYTIFIGMQWEKLGMGGRIAISFFPIPVLWGIGFFLRLKGFKQAGGLLVFVGTGIFPLLVYTLQHAAGLWPDASQYHYEDYYRFISTARIMMEVVSITIAVIMIFVTRFPLISLLIAFWSWFLSMDMMHWITKSTWGWADPEKVISILMGLGMLAIGMYLQHRTRKDYSIWFYFFGHILVLTNLTALAFSREGLFGILYLLVYVTFIIGSVWLQRRIFLVFGAIGSYSYLCYLAFRVFNGGLGFVFGLAAVGLFIVLSAVGYQKYIRPWLEEQFGHARFAVL